jgi:predicted aspartyl protease
MAGRRHLGGDPLGRAKVSFAVANNREVQKARDGEMPADRVRWVQLEGVVDSGASLLVLPGDVADRLGFPRAGEALVRYGDRRSATRSLVEEVRVELLGRQGTFRALLEPDRTTALIGAIVLEDLDLTVDCKNDRLEPRDPEHINVEVE